MTSHDQDKWTPSEKDVKTLARVCHEANRALCVSQGDTSQPDWDSAPDWQKESCISGVRLHLAADFVDADSSHDHWMMTKIRDGWRYGRVKDAEKKEHPCLIPRRFLQREQRVKDDIFAMICFAYKNEMARPST